MFVFIVDLFLCLHKKRAKLQKKFDIYKFICTFAEKLLKNDTWTYLFDTDGYLYGNLNDGSRGLGGDS